MEKHKGSCRNMPKVSVVRTFAAGQVSSEVRMWRIS
jgi:hypothetical protein